MSLTDITDCKPNQATIDQLEVMLERAKAGKLRSVISIKAWNDDTVTHGWSVDGRNSYRRVLAEIVMLQHNFVTNLGFMEGDTVLSRAFEVE